MMKLHTPYARETMANAQALQARYDRLGASRHQSIRNPVPMRELVLTALPTIPAPDANITVTRTVTAKINGKTYRKRVSDVAVAADVLPASTWENAPTVDEVTAALQAKGFFASKGTVAVSLHTARYFSGVRSMRFTRPRTAREKAYGLRRNSSYCRYFIAATV